MYFSSPSLSLSSIYLTLYQHFRMDVTLWLWDVCFLFTHINVVVDCWSIAMNCFSLFSSCFCVYVGCVWISLVQLPCLISRRRIISAWFLRSPLNVFQFHWGWCKWMVAPAWRKYDEKYIIIINYMVENRFNVFLSMNLRALNVQTWLL